MKDASKSLRRNGLLNRRTGSTPLTEANCRQQMDRLRLENFARLSGNEAVPIYVGRAHRGEASDVLL